MSARSGAVVSIAIGLAMIAAALGAKALTPRGNANLPVALAQLVPTEFGDWREVRTNDAQINPADTSGDERTMSSPYDDILMRAYRNSAGEVIFLALAYGKNQRQEVKIHRPDLCYVSQGFEVIRRAQATMQLAGQSGGAINGARMLVTAPGRIEAVSYWMRIGDFYGANAWAARYYIFREGLSGRVPDGVLVRASQIVTDTDAAPTRSYGLQQRFLSELVAAVPPSARGIFVSRETGI